MAEGLYGHMMAAAARVKPPPLSSRHVSRTSKGRHDTELLFFLNRFFFSAVAPDISMQI